VYLLHVNKVVIHLPFPLLYEGSLLAEAAAQKGKQTKQLLVTELDLTKIDGDGDFPCPKCGAIISPEDETEDVYTILEEKVNNEVLEEMLIQCNKCGSRIRLTGFSFLEADASNLE
jgi:DNA-directed RNA polymerase subunit RPC12/RpoP